MDKNKPIYTNNRAEKCPTKGNLQDDFDPDNFDWGDENCSDIRMDDISGDVISTMVSAAMQASEEAFGWAWIKRDDVEESRKKLFKVKQVVTSEDDRAWVEREWPAYSFVWDTAQKHHDHPLSHIATELNEIEMTDDLVANATKYIDLFGNGKRDVKYRRKCYNVYTLATAKDYIRNQHPSVVDYEYNLAELCDPNSVLGKINDITCTHALYYLSMDDIGRIVNTSQKRRIRALVHRHTESSGTLNRGELAYTVDFDGNVVQRNVATGEEYRHQSLEALFHQSSAKTEFGGVTWTTRKAGGDSFFIDIVGCPVEKCESYVPLSHIKPETRTTVELNGVTVKTFLHWTWMVFSSENGSVSLEDMDLFTKLRRFASCKMRDARLMVELAHLARRLTNKSDIIAIHGGGAHAVSAARLSDYVNAAFYVDVKHELETAIAFQEQNKKMVTALNSYYEKGVLPTDFTMVTKAMHIVSGAAGSTVEATVRVAEAIMDDERLLKTVKNIDFAAGTVFENKDKKASRRKALYNNFEEQAALPGTRAAQIKSGIIKIKDPFRW